MRYKIALHKSDEGYSVSAPGLPGCWSQGKTEAEAPANIEAAIREYFSVVDDLLKDAEVREIELTVETCPSFRASTPSIPSHYKQDPSHFPRASSLLLTPSASAR